MMTRKCPYCGVRFHQTITAARAANALYWAAMVIGAMGLLVAAALFLS